MQKKKAETGAAAVAFGSTPAFRKALGVDESHKAYVGRVVSLLLPRDGVTHFDYPFEDKASGQRCRYFVMKKKAYDQMLSEAGRMDPTTLRHRVDGRRDMKIDHAKHGALWNAGYAYDHCPLCTSPLIDPTDANVFAEKAKKIVQIVRE